MGYRLKTRKVLLLIKSTSAYKMRYLEISGLKSDRVLSPEERDFKHEIPPKNLAAVAMGMGINADEAEEEYHEDRALLKTKSEPFELERSAEPDQELSKRTGTA